MATSTRNFRLPFDRDQEFVASRPLRVSGKEFGPGDSFDTTLVTTRRLHQMYERRWVHYSNPQGVMEKARQKLTDKGKVPTSKLEPKPKQRRRLRKHLSSPVLA